MIYQSVSGSKSAPRAVKPKLSTPNPTNSHSILGYAQHLAGTTVAATAPTQAGRMGFQHWVKYH